MVSVSIEIIYLKIYRQSGWSAGRKKKPPGLPSLRPKRSFTQAR